MNDLFLIAFNKFLRDEVSAAVSYMCLGNKVRDQRIADEIKEHADDEWDHAKRLMTFAYNHGFGDQLKPIYDEEVLTHTFALSDDTEIVKYIQTLERKAIDDYKSMVQFCREHMNIETAQFFIKLMKEEMEHFDDLAPYVGQYRDIE